MPEMAMFPLGSVLFPGMVLPLQVFEPRYRAMMQRCMAGDRQFGVTLIERGSEVGGGDVRSMVGTVAEVAEARETPDGRWAVVAVGRRRIRVAQWLTDDPFPLAEVDDWPDAPVAPQDEPGTTALLGGLIAQYRRTMALAAELGHPARPLVELADEPLECSYQLAMMSPLGPLDRQNLLLCPGPVERLGLLGDLLDGIEMELRARLSGG